MRNKSFAKRVIFWVTISIVFLGLSVLVVILAGGYRVNWQNRTVQQTGLIMLKGDLSNVKVSIDNKKVSDRVPVRITYLFPGWHEVTITRSGYHTWRKSVWVENGLAYEVGGIVLFRNDTKVEIVSDKATIRSINQTLMPLDIYISNNEIRSKGKLITRLSQTPAFVNWSNDHAHVIYQMNNEIHIIDGGGSNDVLLTKLESSSASIFKTTNNDKFLVFTDGAQVKRLQIQ